MNKIQELPENIFSELGITFTNVTNRIIANQYPYEVETKTLYINDAIEFKEILKNNNEPTVYIIRNTHGDFIDTIFIPKIITDGEKRYFEIKNEKNINKRLPLSFLEEF